MEVERYGEIKVLALVNEQWEPRTLENVLCVPKVKKNLYSIGTATNKNLKVVFKENKLEIFRLLAVGIKQVNYCYKMLFKIVRNCRANVSVSNPVMLWHERLGHVNFQTLKKMIDSKQLPGMTTGSVDGLFYEACQHGKLARLPFNKTVKERISKPAEVIHMDVCGKMTHSSIGGALTLCYLRMTVLHIESHSIF